MNNNGQYWEAELRLSVGAGGTIEGWAVLGVADRMFITKGTDMDSVSEGALILGKNWMEIER
jgi:hypothetical protein